MEIDSKTFRIAGFDNKTHRKGPKAIKQETLHPLRNFSTHARRRSLSLIRGRASQGVSIEDDRIMEIG
ncbi:MAG: hypothetical protein OIN86_05165 [Candidatus Methanoperedens sp.]|nr:hypothetical protein [Candidatus Methanoperedens sp.]